MGNIQNCKLSVVKAPSDFEGLKKLVLKLVEEHNQLVKEVEDLETKLRYAESRLK